MTTTTAHSLDILEPGDAGYDEARTVWNAMVDHHPRAIVRATSAYDVAAAVRMARERGLEIGVRCGGHNIVGLSVPHDGLMIDLRPMDKVHVDPRSRRAWVQGGAPLGNLDKAAQAYGLATTAGNVSHTGVGGLTLGGGMGWLARAHGLACDNVAAYTLVTAAGDVVRATPEERPDLFWGLRGGGGNFGIVVEFEFRLHHTGTQTLVADFTFALEDAKEALQGWREFTDDAPRAATTTATIRDDRVELGFVYVGDPAQGRALLPGLRAIGRAQAEDVQTLDYVTLQSRDDTVQGHAVRRYWKGHYLPDLSGAAIDALLAGRGEGKGIPTASLQSYGGAIADVPDADSAFSHRDTRFELVAAGGWAERDEDAARMDLIRRTAGRLDPFAAGAYVNALSDEGVKGVSRAYTPAKLARLTAVKDAYDPDNVFHLNHNIVPSRHASNVSTTR
jgi:FAD/FMN-containing dehydrogenase